jgi:NADH:ubiquinone oxidoreductase subunit C
LFSNHPKVSLQVFFVEKSFWAKILLLSRLTLPNSLTYVVDGIQFNNGPNEWLVQYNLSTLLTDSRIHVYTEITKFTYSLTSISKIFKSATWLERELGDFTNIYFEGLTDTRRLLLDYFQEKQGWRSHISNERSFNNNFYEVTLNY